MQTSGKSFSVVFLNSDKLHFNPVAPGLAPIQSALGVCVQCHRSIILLTTITCSTNFQPELLAAQMEHGKISSANLNKCSLRFEQIKIQIVAQENLGEQEQ